MHGLSSGTLATQSSQACGLLDPHIVVTKGRVAKRMKGPLELPRSGAKMCRGCNKLVVGHDKRNCPYLKTVDPTNQSYNTDVISTARGMGRGRGRRGIFLSIYCIRIFLRRHVGRREMASSSTGSIYQSGYKLNCSCGLPTVVLTSHTRKNPGRRFLRCSQYKDSTRRCSFFRWLDEGSQSTGYGQVHVDSESEVLPCKNQKMGAQSNVNTDKHGEIAGDIGDLLQCISMMNHEIRHLKKEVRFLKEADRRRELDASAIKRNQGFIVLSITSLPVLYNRYGKKLFILVDNRPWLIDADSRSAHLWQLMVTKRMSPFANTRARLDRKDIGRRLDLKIVDVALYQKKVTLPVKKLRDSLLLNSELHRTLYGFIVFEVSWNDVRGINYLNELQTDTSLALETKLMKRWEFDSIEQASKYMFAWFSGTHNECILLQEYLDNISDSGEVYYDAQDDPSVLDLESDGVYTHNEHGSPKDRSHNAAVRNFELSRADMEYKTRSFHTPPPPSGSYKRRKTDEMCE
ncbi:hypothetical protein ACLOJK_013849 [Asimina triloba]